MSCEHLVCAACSGPVEEGRCMTCRTARAQLHPHGHPFRPELLMLLVALLLTLALLAAHH